MVASKIIEIFKKEVVFVKISKFMMALVFTLVMSSAFSNSAFAASTKTVPSSYNGAIVKKTLIDTRAQWSQDEHTYYLKPAKARAFASKIERGTATQVSQYITSTLVGIKFTTPGALIGGVTLLDNLRRSELANEIRAKSEKGPVKFTLVKHRYGWGYGAVTSWNGSSIDISEPKPYDLKGYAFIE